MSSPGNRSIRKDSRPRKRRWKRLIGVLIATIIAGALGSEFPEMRDYIARSVTQALE